MRRYGNIFDKITDLDNIRHAHEKASKDKRFYKEVKMINKNPERYFYEIRDMLINKTYNVTEVDYKTFTKIDKGKERIIHKLDYYPHRIIQWALMLQIQDIFHKGLIRNTFSSIPNRGIHDAAKRLHRDMKDKEATKYCLKIDVKKFYPSIDHAVSREQIRNKIKDPNVIWLCDLYIDGMGGGVGAPIGSLFSQWQGNINLSPLDHWLKETKQVKFLYRYCDDIVILHHDKNYLHKLKEEIRTFLNDKLKLDLKDNEQVFPTFVRGIDFVGYRFFGDYILLRKTTAKNLKRSMSKLLKRCNKGIPITYGEWCSINSYKGWLKFCNGHNLFSRYIKPLLPHAEKYYKEVVLNEENQRDSAA